MVRYLLVLLLLTQLASSQSSPVQRLLGELPACSILRAELEHRPASAGINQPYMIEMQQQGVRRALIQVSAVLRGPKPTSIQVKRRLYFSQFDGPNSQISDESALKKIEASGLQTALDGIAHDRVLAAPLFRGTSGHVSSKEVSSFVEFFADASLPEQRAMLFPSGHPKPLTEAVVNGDVLATQMSLQMPKIAKNDLDQALFDATLSRYDNTAVIKLLLDAGANVNARTPDGTTPLMNAVPHPCNLRPLLAGGAELNARDKWGRNAFQLAREAKVSAAISLLEEAAR